MHILVIIPTIFYLLMIFFIPHTQSAGICPSFSCNHLRKHFPIHFPFRVPRNQSNRCGYPRFDLSCSSHGETFLRLPSSPSEPLIIDEIDYADQILWVSDPNGCVPKRVMNLNLTGSPYMWGPYSVEYTFLRCSGPVDPTQLPVGSSVVRCLSEQDFTAVLTFEKEAEEKLLKLEGKCHVTKRVVAPLWWRGLGYGFYPMDMSDVLIQLSWELPGCGDCVVRGGSCGFVGNSGLDVGCFLIGGNGGLPRSAKYGLILGAGMPGLLFMIGLSFYLSRRVRAYNQSRNHANAESSSTITPQPIILTLGLDDPTIESYPKTVLGESKRLPKLSDGTCPICLSEYEPKETLRAIPDCNHHFHAECIDEWLRVKATCPLCRNSPQKSSENGS